MITRLGQGIEQGMMMRYWLCACLLLLAGAGGAQELRIGEIAPVRILTGTPAPLALPSDVAVADNGWAYVVDGGNHRIVIYNAFGDIVSSVGAYGSGEGQFSEPLGIAVDRSGLVYVADSGNNRIQILRADGTFLRMFALSEGGVAVRPADVAVSELNGNIFVTGNNTHKVMKFTPQGEFVASWGEEGTGRGQFRYPATLVVQQGNVAVVDVLNTRVQIFDEEGRYQHQMSEWGVMPGQLFRPKGVAIDQRGWYYISDSYMEVVQVFDSAYHFVHVLGQGGKAHKFVTPVGLSVSKDERLYVTEMLGNRVSVFELH